MEAKEKHRNKTSLKKVMQFAKLYRARFVWVVVFAVALSIFAAIRPYLLKQTVDDYLLDKHESGLLNFVLLMAAVLLFEVASQF
jgi:ATP-binding cassette subfamily B multidrug efflux pump